MLSLQREDNKFDSNAILILNEDGKKPGYVKELNKVSWNGGAPKYDIRDWAPEHEKMGKGVTLSEEELEKLKELIKSNN